MMDSISYPKSTEQESEEDFRYRLMRSRAMLYLRYLALWWTSLYFECKECLPPSPGDERYSVEVEDTNLIREDLKEKMDKLFLSIDKIALGSLGYRYLAIKSQDDNKKTVEGLVRLIGKRPLGIRRKDVMYMHKNALYRWEISAWNADYLINVFSAPKGNYNFTL